jgi:hypothetical protein
MIVEPNIDVARKGVIIGSATKLGSGLGGVSTGRNQIRSSALPTTTIEVVGVPQLVFINLITTTHVNKIVD